MISQGGVGHVCEKEYRRSIIGVAAIVPHNAMADSLMEEISLFVEENCEADILDETREIR